MNKINITILFVCVLLCCANSNAENIDPYNDGSQYTYGENVGWLNFEPSTGDGVQVEFARKRGSAPAAPEGKE